MGNGTFPVLASALEEYRALAKTCNWRPLLTADEHALLLTAAETSQAWAAFLTEKPKAQSDTGVDPREDDAEMVDVDEKIGEQADGEAGSPPAGTEVSPKLAAFVRQALSVLAVDNGILGGSAKALAAATFDDERFEEDPGPDDFDDARCRPDLKCDPAGIYLLLDADEATDAIAAESSSVAKLPLSSPLLHSNSSQKRARRRSTNHVFGFALSEHVAQFVREMRELCEAVREQHCNTPTTVGKSGGKPSKSTSRREAASAANVIEALEGLESQARGGRYERVEDCIRQVSSCIANQETTFSEILPVLSEKGSALRKKENAMVKHIVKLERLRSVSVGVLGSGEMSARHALRAETKRYTKMEIDENELAPDCGPAVGDQPENLVLPDEGDPNRIERRAEVRPPHVVSVEKGEHGCKNSNPSSSPVVEAAKGVDPTSIFLNLNPWVTTCSVAHKHVAAEAAERTTLHDIEKIWRRKPYAEAFPGLDYIKAVRLLPEFASLASTTTWVALYSGENSEALSHSSSCPYAEEKHSSSLTKQSISHGCGLQAHNLIPQGPIARNVAGIQRVRDLRQRLFAILDREDGSSAIAVTNAGDRSVNADGNRLEYSSQKCKLDRHLLTNQHLKKKSPDAAVADIIIRNEPPAICKHNADATGNAEPMSGAKQHKSARLVTGLLLSHGGFVESTEGAIDILVDLMGEFVMRVGRSLASCREPRVPVRPHWGGPNGEKMRADTQISRLGSMSMNFSLPSSGPSRSLRTREETLEIARLISASGFRGGFPELRNYVQYEIPRTAAEIQEAENKVRSKISEFAALAGTHLSESVPTADDGRVEHITGCDRLDPVDAQPLPPENPPIGFHGSNESVTQEQPQIDETFTFEEDARHFGIMNSCTRLDILNGLYVPRALVAKVFVDEANAVPEAGHG